MNPDTAQPSRGRDVRVKYFPTSPHVTKEIEAWAREANVRVLSIVPVYWEDAPRG